MKKIALFMMVLLSLSVLVSAHGEETFAQAEEIIKEKISCEDLGDEQLEFLGDYYMEQMHPGEAHEAMHEMMGIEEGTDYHEQFHVNIAKMMYCGEGGMMGMMPMMGNMMGKTEDV